ncbi:hypothetical protein PIB30_068612 [Stylosanthes scabra]|uniref:Uncharacterized protein n=1 Tax=Stylosanthes scabra TaxID=79078 RepID=A0ABU6YLY5_9FABA|nr:hypothetical protein [Stylosanthes scabra]
MSRILKIGSDRPVKPVELRTDDLYGSIQLQKPEMIKSKVLKTGSVIEPFKLPHQMLVQPSGNQVFLFSRDKGLKPKSPILENFHLGERTGRVLVRSNRSVSGRFTGSIPAFSRAVSACRSIRFHDRATVEPGARSPDSALPSVLQRRRCLTTSPPPFRPCVADPTPRRRHRKKERKMSGQTQRLNVVPTVTMLGVMKARLVGATRGHALLKKKSDALTVQFRQILKKIVSTKESMGLPQGPVPAGECCWCETSQVRVHQ